MLLQQPRQQNDCRGIFSGRDGFTLVEILVASTIGAFVALVAVGTLRVVTASSEMVDRNIGAAGEVRFASNMISRDLVNLYRDTNRESTRLIGTVVQSGQENLSYLVLYTVGRTKARFEQPEGDIYEAEYYLLQSEDKSMLVRRYWPNPNKEYEPGGILTVLAEGIDVFEVRYYDGEEWSNEWPEEMQTLPALIEVSIAATPTGGGEIVGESFIVNFARLASSGMTSTESNAEGQGESGTGGQGESSGQSSEGSSSGGGGSGTGSGGGGSGTGSGGGGQSR